MSKGARTESYEAVVVGVSFGGLQALEILIPQLSSFFPAPVMIVQHHGAQADDFLARHLSELGALPVKIAVEKELAKNGMVFIAPANYHLMVETDRTFSLSVDERVNFSRPSIDVLFESAADVYARHLVGVVLTGANNDGAAGLKRIKALGGYGLVQDPETAVAPVMPEAAIRQADPDLILPLEEIGPHLNELFRCH